MHICRCQHYATENLYLRCSVAIGVYPNRDKVLPNSHGNNENPTIMHIAENILLVYM